MFSNPQIGPSFKHQQVKKSNIQRNLLIPLSLILLLFLIVGGVFAFYYFVLKDKQDISSPDEVKKEDRKENNDTNDSRNEDQYDNRRYALVLGSDINAKGNFGNSENMALVGYDLLVKYYHYNQSNVKLLLNKDVSWIEEWIYQGGIEELGDEHELPVTYNNPTTKDFRESMNWLAENVSPEHKVVIMIFAHGSQVDDISGDEYDNIDETVLLNDGYVLDDEIATLIGKIKAREIIMLFASCYSSGMIRDIETEVDDSTRLRIIATSPEELPYQSNVVDAGSDFDFPYPDRWQNTFGILLFGLTDMQVGKVSRYTEDKKSIEDTFRIFSKNCRQDDMNFEAHIVEVFYDENYKVRYKCLFCGEMITSTIDYQPIYGYFNSDLSNEFYF